MHGVTRSDHALKTTAGYSRMSVAITDFPDPLIRESGVLVRHRRITWIPRCVPQPGFRRVWDPLGWLPSALRRPGLRIKRDGTRLLLSFKEAHARHKVERLLESTALMLEDGSDEVDLGLVAPVATVNHTGHLYWVRSRSGQAIEQSQLGALPEGHLAWIGPVYRLPALKGRRGLFCPLPHVLLVKPITLDDKPALVHKLSRPPFNMREVEPRSRLGGGYLYFVLNDAQHQSVYEFPRLLKNEKTLVQEARFENVYLLSGYAHVPSDPYYAAHGPYRGHPGQWNMRQIAAEAGWDLTKGNQNIIVCVLDQGCDLDHPDLQACFTNGYNLDTTSSLRPGEADPAEPHGTACAGIIAAHMDNRDHTGSLIGVAGLAPACRIMPVAFPFDTPAYIAEGIRYAADNGARVISLSYSADYYAADPEDKAAIDKAIAYACTPDPARNRPGVVLCVCTHDDDREGVRYPANDPLVLACGASDQDDYRKNPKSRDRECWGSNWGEGLSVVAPGVLIPTTDNIGPAEGNNANRGGALPKWCVDYETCGDKDGKYFFLFNGTSAATPHVAALAALILSVNPALTNFEVRDIIEQTADKVHDAERGGLYRYDSRGWNDRVGFGRINVVKALQRAMAPRG